MNPWERIKAVEYEGHMKFIKQYDLLNHIVKEQIEDNCPSIIDIVGIGCGNGLQHIKTGMVVYGYDINQDFLNVCKEYGQKNNLNLVLKRIDLTAPKATINQCDLIICNLVIEFLGLVSFIRLLKKSKPKIISVVLQMTIEDTKAISESPYTDKFRELVYYRTEVDPNQLISMLYNAGYMLKCSKSYDLDQTKYLIRMDFNQVSKIPDKDKA